MAKPDAVLNHTSVFGRPGREVIEHLCAGLLALFPSCHFTPLPPQNLFRRWVELTERFNYDSTAFAVYDLIFFERILDLKENSAASRSRFLEQTHKFLAALDYRARGINAAFALDAENLQREVLRDAIREAFPDNAQKATRILIDQSRALQLAINDFFERALVRALNENERLLTNILPRSVSEELIKTGHVAPVLFNDCAVLFTDFVGFTALSEKLGPNETLTRLERYFSAFDDIVSFHGLEKIKTIGDSYMAVAGVPSPHPSAVRASCLAALDIMETSNLIRDELAQSGPTWGIRIGLHAGQVLAGVIGKTKFSYDVWGATVNLASRMETASVPGRINVSRAIHDPVSQAFEWEPRGRQPVKHLEDVEMFFLLRAKALRDSLPERRS